MDRLIELELAFLGDTASSNDFVGTRLPFSFGSASSTGDIQCSAVGLNRDGIVEEKERFIIILSSSSDVEDVNISRSEGEVWVEDSPLDCKLKIKQ